MNNLILVSKNLKILGDMLAYTPHLPRVLLDKKLNKPVNFYIESKNDGTPYYYFMTDCGNELLEYIKGFCCGYMAGKDFDNSK